MSIIPQDPNASETKAPVVANNVAASVEDGETPRYSRREVLLTMAGVLLVMLLASLDQTIVATAMPRVIADLNGYDLYTWVTTAYLLTSTVMVPIYGKLSDMFGRKRLFLFGVILFLLGSGLSGASQSIYQLIAFRAFQGLGAAALMPIAIAVVGDLFTPRERGRWQGVTGAVFGLSSVVGPVTGGWITEHSTWRWVFYVNLPIGLVALFVLIFLMPNLQGKGGKVAIDYVGAALLIAGSVPLLLGFTWAGSDYAWLSPQIIGLFSGSVLMLVLFVVYEALLERRIARGTGYTQPIIGPSLFKNSVFTIAVAITAVTSMGMFGCIFFLPLFAQGVLGISATYSGLILTPLMLSLVASSVISGQLVSRTGKYKLIAIVGMVITLAGAAILLFLDQNSTNMMLTLAMIVFGLGLGFGMALYTLIVQNALPRQIGQATATLTFFRSIGGTIALAAMGSVMTSAYQPAFHDSFSKSIATLPAPLQQAFHIPQFKAGIDKIIGALDNPNILLSSDAQAKLHSGLIASFSSPKAFGPQLGPTLGEKMYTTLLDAVKVGLAQGIHNVFIMSFVIICVGLLLSFFLKEIPLRGGRAAGNRGEAGEGEHASPMMMH